MTTSRHTCHDHPIGPRPHRAAEIRLDDGLRDLADAQGGVFTTAQAHRCGVSSAVLGHLTRAGVVASLGRSAHAVAESIPDAPVARHAQRARAALLVYPDAHLCGASLLAEAGIALWGVSLDRVELVRPVNREVLTQMCRIRPASDLVRPAGADRASLAAAVVQLALDEGFVPAVVAGDHALHSGRADLEVIGETVGGLSFWARSARARTMLSLLDGRSESVGESRLRILLGLNGIATVPQVVIRLGAGRMARVDLLVDGTNVVIEFDGKVKYGSGDGTVLFAEKKREDAIRREGYLVERVVWADLERPRLLVARIREAVARSAPRKVTVSGTTVVG